MVAIDRLVIQFPKNNIAFANEINAMHHMLIKNGKNYREVMERVRDIVLYVGWPKISEVGAHQAHRFAELVKQGSIELLTETLPYLQPLIPIREVDLCDAMTHFAKVWASRKESLL